MMNGSKMHKFTAVLELKRTKIMKKKTKNLISKKLNIKSKRKILLL